MTFREQIILHLDSMETRELSLQREVQFWKNQANASIQELNTAKDMLFDGLYGGVGEAQEYKNNLTLLDLCGMVQRKLQIDLDG